jgi:hypothetical protein
LRRSCPGDLRSPATPCGSNRGVPGRRRLVARPEFRAPVGYGSRDLEPALLIMVYGWMSLCSSPSFHTARVESTLVAFQCFVSTCLDVCCYSCLDLAVFVITHSSLQFACSVPVCIPWLAHRLF